MKYYYPLRSNRTHRGKAGIEDHKNIWNSLAELLPIFRNVLKAAESDACSALRHDPWNNQTMKGPFAATVWREGNWCVSQCIEVYVASQGESEAGALANLKEALELHFEEPHATRAREVRLVEVEIGAA